MNFALGVGYIVIGVVSIIVGMLVIWLLTKLWSKIPKIKINKKLKSISEDFFMILFVSILLITAITSVSCLAYEVGKFIIGLF